MCRYADIDKEFVLADFIREDTLYLKQVSRKKGLPEEKSKKADAYNKTAQEYNEAVDALVQHYPEAAHTDELEQIAQLMNRKSAADRDGLSVRYAKSQRRCKCNLQQPEQLRHDRK